MSLLTLKLMITAGALAVILIILYLVGHKSVHSELFVPATPQQVWSVLLDTDNYERWNTVLVLHSGELIEGNEVTYEFRQDDENSYEISSRVQGIVDGRLLNQRGGLPGVLTFDHRYVLEPADSGTNVIIHEDYRGIAVPFWNPAPVQAAYDRLNRAMKARVMEVHQL